MLSPVSREKVIFPDECTKWNSEDERFHRRACRRLPVIWVSSVCLSMILICLRFPAYVVRWGVQKCTCDRICYLTEFLGGEYGVEGDYPAWEYREDSPLRDLMVRIYEKNV